MRHKQGTIEYAQGWLGNQLEQAAAEQMTEQTTEVGEKVLAMWKTVDEALDDLLAERAHLLRTLNDVRVALGYDVIR